MANYVDNEAFYEALKEHRIKYLEAKSNGHKSPQASKFIGECIIAIATHYSYKHRFLNYSYREELVGDAIEICIRYLNSYDPEKSKNPFSYFTTTCHREFFRTLKKESKQKKIKDAILLDANAEEFDLQEHDEGNHDFHNTYADFQRDNIYEYSDRGVDE